MKARCYRSEIYIPIIYVSQCEITLSIIQQSFRTGEKAERESEEVRLMDLQTLHFFAEAADAGSCAAAAEKLNYAQSNLSNRIKQLEEELGEPLFYRYKRGVMLTAKGKVFYDYARRILNLTEEAAKAVRDMEHARGKLTLGSLEATALGDLPDLLASYHRQYPDVSLSLQTDMNDVFIEQVLKRELDGAFVSGPLNHPELEECFFKSEKLILVSGNDNRLDNAETILAHAPLITFPEGSVFRRRLELLLTSRSIAYMDRLTVLNSLGAMMANISAGIGCGYLPRSIVQPYLDSGVMAEYPLDDPYSELDVVFLYRRDHVPDAAFRYFLKQLQKETH